MGPWADLHISRRNLLGAAAGTAAVGLLAACGSASPGSGETAQFGDGDVGLLNYALTVEYLQGAVYDQMLASGVFAAPVEELLGEFREDERRHASALAKHVSKLGGEPVGEPKTRIRVRSAKSGLELAARIENLAAAAYLGQVPRFEDPSALGLVLSIQSVEGRHAQAIENLLGEPAGPGPFARPAPVHVTLRSIEPLVVS